MLPPGSRLVPLRRVAGASMPGATLWGQAHAR